MKIQKIGADIVKDNKMKMVLDNDLAHLLKSLNVYDGVLKKEYKCLFCDDVITVENIDSIVPYNGTVQFTCDKPLCHMKLIGWKK